MLPRWLQSVAKVRGHRSRNRVSPVPCRRRSHCNRICSVYWAFLQWGVGRKGPTAKTNVWKPMSQKLAWTLWLYICGSLQGFPRGLHLGTTSALCKAAAFSPSSGYFSLIGELIPECDGGSLTMRVLITSLWITAQCPGEGSKVFEILWDQMRDITKTRLHLIGDKSWYCKFNIVWWL